MYSRSTSASVPAVGKEAAAGSAVSAEAQRDGSKVPESGSQMVEIQAPRLTEPKEDRALLPRHFIARFAVQHGKEVRGLMHRAQIRLSQHFMAGQCAGSLKMSSDMRP